MSEPIEVQIKLLRQIVYFVTRLERADIEWLIQRLQADLRKAA
jgi:hypothetical protein